MYTQCIYYIIFTINSENLKSTGPVKCIGFLFLSNAIYSNMISKQILDMGREKKQQYGNKNGHM